MSDDPKTLELQIARILLNNGQTVDMTIPAGSFSTYANRVKADGMAWNDDIAIPYDSIFLIQRVEPNAPISADVKRAMN